MRDLEAKGQALAQIRCKCQLNVLFGNKNNSSSLFAVTETLLQSSAEKPFRSKPVRQSRVPKSSVSLGQAEVLFNRKFSTMQIRRMPKVKAPNTALESLPEQSDLMMWSN